MMHPGGGRYRIPLLGYVSAGTLETPADAPLGDVFVALPHTGGDLFGLVVRGDSMTEAGIADGQVVLIRRQRVFRDGEVVVAAVDGQVTLKHLYRDEGGYRLEAAHPGYPPLHVTEEAVWYGDAPPLPYRAEPHEALPPEVHILGLLIGQMER